MARPDEKTVLVVDDDADVVYYLSTALEDAGFRVELAFSVDEALEKVRQHPPDFVSLDMVMPKKSGIVLYHELRRHAAWKQIPVLFVTGKAKDEHVKRDLDAALADSSMVGPSTYLEKPVTAERFVAAVAGQLGVSLATGATDPGAGVDDGAREELRALVDSADPDTIRRVLELLKTRTNRP